MTIAAHLHCVDCRIGFAVTRRQCHAGLVAPVVRCPKCRARRRRELGRRWDRANRPRNRRLAEIRPESAPVHALAHQAGVERLLAAVYGDDERIAS